MHRHETLLQVLTSESPTSRVSLWMVRCEFSGESRLRMRQESFSDDVGWFTQTHLDLTPDQLSQLKGGIGFHAHPSHAKKSASIHPAKPRVTVIAGSAPREGLGDRETGSAPREILRLPTVLAG